MQKYYNGSYIHAVSKEEERRMIFSRFFNNNYKLSYNSDEESIEGIKKHLRNNNFQGVMEKHDGKSIRFINWNLVQSILIEEK